MTNDLMSKCELYRLEMDHMNQLHAVGGKARMSDGEGVEV